MQRPLLLLARFATRMYYRSTRLGGTVPPGPVLLVANHPNGLVDPVFLAEAAGRPVRFLGKAPLFDLPVLGTLVRGLRTIPVYRRMDGADTGRNESSFEAAYEALGAGDVICIFPEGTSHSEPRLLDLRTGAARMALGAEARHDFRLGVQIVPVGLIYRARRRFRSEVATWVGPAFPLSDLRAAHTADERQAVRLLTERIAGALRSVTIELERWEDLALLELVDRLLADTAGPRWPRIRAFAARARTLRRERPGDVEELGARLARFRDQLDRLGLAVDDVGRRYSVGRVLRFLARSLPVAALGLPLALTGTALWWLPYRVVPLITSRLDPEPSIFASVQILAGAVLFPLWLATLGSLAWWLFGGAAAVLFVLAAVLLGPLTIVFWDWWSGTASNVGAFLRRIPRSERHGALVAERAALTAALEQLGGERPTGVRPGTPPAP